MRKWEITVAVVGIIALAGVVGYVIGSFNASDRLLNMDVLHNWLDMSDRGCERIEREAAGLYCKIPLEAEDEAVFIIKLNGSRDDY